MAFVAEDGTGKSDANSLCSVADADAYFANVSNAAWAALLTADKEAALVQATRYVELVYGDRFLNRRNSLEQALTWPRCYMKDRDGFAIGSDVVPQSVKDAVCELALLAAGGEDLQPDIDNPGMLASESVSVGPVTESKSYVGGQSQIKRYTKVERLLRQWCSSGGTIYRA